MKFLCVSLEQAENRDLRAQVDELKNHEGELKQAKMQILKLEKDLQQEKINNMGLDGALRQLKLTLGATSNGSLTATPVVRDEGTMGSEVQVAHDALVKVETKLNYLQDGTQFSEICNECEKKCLLFQMNTF